MIRLSDPRSAALGLFVGCVATVAAAAAAEVRVYEVPAGAHPHDVAPAPDGAVWYTAQHHGALGILDPATGAVREVALGSGSRPHGVIQGPAGNAWITDGGQNAIVRYDPLADAVTVWRLPADAGYANLNTAALDAGGVLWFTGESGIYGRLDPATGAIEVFPAPRGRGPYGIAATPDGTGVLRFARGSYVGRIDGRSGAVSVIEPPTPRQGARRVWADSSGNVWVAEWNAGQLSRFTPGSGAWRSWKLPGEGPRAYAVYVDERDVVWVSDFGANAVLSFDPETEAFTAYPGSGRGARVRQILGRAGEVWLPESGLDRLVRIRY